MTHGWHEQPGELVGLRGLLTSDKAVTDLAGRLRVGGVTYRVRCWRCEERGGRVQWQMQLEPDTAGASTIAQPAAKEGFSRVL
jgi:hypothetical protein